MSRGRGGKSPVLSDIIDYSLRLKAIEDQSEFQMPLAWPRRRTEGTRPMAPINTEVGYRFIRDKILSGRYARASLC